jgi:hypothetical protein
MTLSVNEPYITISPPITVHHGWSRRIGPRDMNEALAELVLPFLQENVLCMEKRVVGLRWGGVEIDGVAGNHINGWKFLLNFFLH